MTERQLEILRGYTFPKYYKWFYNFFRKYIGISFVVLFFTIFVLMIIYNNSNWDGFNFIRSIVFGVFGIGLWVLSAYLTKKIHLKIYLKKVGMSLSEWNSLTKGLSIDDINKL